ncbi:MAG: response regulator transcription factor [gamma proteobacterium symbiont of Taylorina sp.]|nr:response regulator transcription factor [gamma proteobacterium symbiont of Taylorina sp.]
MISLKHITLLYAEDELETLQQYKKYFSNYFKTVHTATDGIQTEALYHQFKPDVLILDINMPGLNGLELCRKVRQKDKKTKIILLTARTDQSAFVEAIELGLTTYLIKPVFTAKLKQALVKISDELKDISRISLWLYNDEYYVWDCSSRELLLETDTDSDTITEALALTKKEKRLLELLVTSDKRKQTYQNIHNAVWYDDIHKDYSEYSIKTLIKSLRHKLPPDTIKNAYGLGFYLNHSPEKF